MAVHCTPELNNGTISELLTIPEVGNLYRFYSITFVWVEGAVQGIFFVQITTCYFIPLYSFSFDSHDPGVFSSPTVCGLIEHYKDPACCMYFEPMLTIPINR